MKLYVVMASTSDYSDRTDWISAIYTDKDTAIQMVDSKTQEARAAEAAVADWHDRVRVLPRYPYKEVPYTNSSGGYSIGIVPIQGLSAREAWEIMNKMILEKCGHCPPDGEAERFWVVEVEPGVWGRYGFKAWEEEAFRRESETWKGD